MDVTAVQIQLLDLDPADGIAPLLDTSHQIDFSDLSGTGQDGPYTEEPLASPFHLPGLRVTTSPGGSWSNARSTQMSEITLSPMTTATFSMLAKVGAGVGYVGEFAAASVALSAFGSGQSSQRDELEATASVPGATKESVRTLTVQIVNATRNALSVGWGWAISIFAISPICRTS
jgi:hypothetical protein